MKRCHNKRSFGSTCLEMLRTNAQRILQENGFGVPLEPFELVKAKPADQLTFIELIGLIFDFRDFKLTGDQVMEIIDRQLGAKHKDTISVDFELTKSLLICPDYPMLVSII